jgi:hypothetical protein
VQGSLLSCGTAVENFVENVILINDGWLNAIRLLSLHSALGVSMRNFRTVQAESVAVFWCGAQEGILDLEASGTSVLIEYPFRLNSSWSSPCRQSDRAGARRDASKENMCLRARGGTTP